MNAVLRLGTFLKLYWVAAALGPVFMTLEAFMDLLQPNLVRRIIDQGIAHGDRSLVLHTGLLMAAALVVSALGGVSACIFAIRAGQGFGMNLRGALFRKVQTFSFGNLDKLETGGLITRLTNDVTQTTEALMMMLRIMVRLPVLLVGAVIMAVLTCPKLPLLFLVLIPAISLILMLILSRTFPLFSLVQRRLDGVNTVMRENLSGVRVIKAFARADHEIDRFGHANDALMNQNIAAIRLTAITMPILMLTINSGVVAALWWGGFLVSTGEIQVGQVIAFNNYLMQAMGAVMGVSMISIQISRAQASAHRIVEVLDTEPTVTSPKAPIDLPDPKGEIAFENVVFSYEVDRGDPVLKDISFVAEAGKTTAILGATGAGKSSLVNLIPRFYDVTGGRVTFDGHDLRDLREEDLRRNVSSALQESVLFSGTIRDNIRYGRPEASQDEVEAAARMAQADDFISSLPDGYDSVVGQRGVNLSGGQKQRIAIARALLTQPKVLILDDSTSAVDVNTETHIQRAMANQPASQTRIVVAQRISTVVNADNILVIDDGGIVAEGTHADLLRSSAIYRAIHDSQVQGGAIVHDG